MSNSSTTTAKYGVQLNAFAAFSSFIKDYCMNEIGKAILEPGLELGHSKTDVVLQESQIPAPPWVEPSVRRAMFIVTICA